MLNLGQYIELVYAIIGSAMEVQRVMSYGLLEPVYQEALHVELLDRGIANEREKEILIHYKNHQLEKKYKMDIVVGDIVVELESVESIHPCHRSQLCNYLRLVKKPLGLLINFGEPSLVAERWTYDEKTNSCYIVDRNLVPIDNINYSDLLKSE